MSATTSHSSDLSGQRETYVGAMQDKPYPVSVCAAILVGVSLGCWTVIIYVASLI